MPAGVNSSGLNGLLHVGGLEAVWLWTVRAWTRDESADLGPTMAALDHALQRAGEASQWLPSPLPTNRVRSRSSGSRERCPATDIALTTELGSRSADKVSDANGPVFPE